MSEVCICKNIKVSEVDICCCEIRVDEGDWDFIIDVSCIYEGVK